MTLNPSGAATAAPDRRLAPAGEGPVVSLRGLRKQYGATEALAGVDLDLRPGEVFGLVGANGAGKSTLIRILAGAVVPDAGEVLVGGSPLRLGDPIRALRAGIATVHQQIDAGILPGHTVAENLALDLLTDPSSGLAYRRGAVHARAAAIASAASLDIDLDARVDRLGSSDRQQIVLARALARAPRLLVLDEPTSALSDREADRLAATVRRMTAAGVGVLYVSHRLGEIAGLAARVGVMREGHLVGVIEDSVSAAEIGAAILGTTLVRRAQDATARAPSEPARSASSDGPTVTRSRRPAALVLRDVRTRPTRPTIDLEVAAGELVGLFGLIGSGKTSLLEGLFGVRRFAAGTVTLGGRPLAPRSPRAAIDEGVHLVPEDRAAQALLREWSVARNLTLPFLATLGRGFLDRGAELRQGRQAIADLRIVARGPAAPVGSLSGGNQQKVVVARWLRPEARLLLLDEPFRGVDLGARADIGARLRATAASRVTLVASSDIDELLEVVDRIVVLHEGAIVHDGPVNALDRDGYAHRAAGGPA